MTDLDFTKDARKPLDEEEYRALQHAILRLDLLKQSKRGSKAKVGEIARIGQELAALMRILSKYYLRTA